MTKIIEIEGIGETYGAALEAAGVSTVEALLKEGSSPAGRQTLAEKANLTTKQILEWVNRADLMRVNGVGSEYSDLLEASGVDTVKELKYRNPANLAAAMREANQKRKLVRLLPTEKAVGRWIDHAKKLPLKITY